MGLFFSNHNQGSQDPLLWGLPAPARAKEPRARGLLAVKGVRTGEQWGWKLAQKGENTKDSLASCVC